MLCLCSGTLAEIKQLLISTTGAHEGQLATDHTLIKLSVPGKRFSCRQFGKLVVLPQPNWPTKRVKIQ